MLALFKMHRHRDDDDLLKGNDALLEELHDLRRMSEEDRMDAAERLWARALANGGTSGNQDDRAKLSTAIVSTRIVGLGDWAALYTSPDELNPEMRRIAERIAAEGGHNEDLLWRASRRLHDPPPHRWIRIGALAPPPFSLPLPQPVLVDPRPEGVEDDLRRDIEHLALQFYGAIPHQTHEEQLELEGVTLSFGLSESDQKAAVKISREDRWLEAEKLGWRRVRRELHRTAGLIAGAANSLAPAYLRERGRIGIALLAPEHWPETPSRLHLVFKEADGLVIDFRELGSGTRRWVAACVREASRRVRSWQLERLNEEGEWLIIRNGAGSATAGAAVTTGLTLGAFDDSPVVYFDNTTRLRPAATPGVFIIDEPEADLHPRAMESIARWLTDLSRQNAAVLVATHAIPFLNLPSESTTFIRLDRVGRNTRLNPMNPDLVGSLKELAEEVGTTPGELLQLYDAVLIVEGIHDERVISHLFGRELAENRIFILRLSGVLEALALVEAELLHILQKQFLVLFDNTSDLADPKSLEEKRLRKVLDFLKGKPWAPLMFPWPDILCALPEESVRLYAKRQHNVSFPGWAKLVAALPPGENIKWLFLSHLGMRLPKAKADQVKMFETVLDEILQETPRKADPQNPLYSVMQDAFSIARGQQGPPATRTP
jgi:hypothetical protein